MFINPKHLSAEELRETEKNIKLEIRKFQDRLYYDPKDEGNREQLKYFRIELRKIRQEMSKRESGVRV